MFVTRKCAVVMFSVACVCVYVCVSACALTFESLDLETSFLVRRYNQWWIQPGARGAMPPPLWWPGNFFACILIFLLSRLHTMARGNTKVAVLEGFYFPKGLCLSPFAVCAVHCMQAAAASFVSPKAVFLACTIGS